MNNLREVLTFNNFWFVLKRLQQESGIYPVLNHIIDGTYFILSVKGAEEAFAHFISALKGNKTIKYLSYFKMSNAGIIGWGRALEGNTTLTEIIISKNQIDDEGAKVLATAIRITTLTYIDISENRIDDEGAIALVEALKDNKNLETLDISNNYIGPAGATAIAGILKTTSIDLLDISHNYIGPVGATAFATALQSNKSLTYLFMEYNQIGDAGVTALAEALENNTTLEHLGINKNQIGFDGITVLATELNYNTSLISVDIYEEYNLATNVIAKGKIEELDTYSIRNKKLIKLRKLFITLMLLLSASNFGETTHYEILVPWRIVLHIANDALLKIE